MVAVTSQDVLFSYSLTSVELCAVADVAARFLDANSTVVPAARASLARTLGYPASVVFLSGLRVCNGTLVPVSRSHPVNRRVLGPTTASPASAGSSTLRARLLSLATKEERGPSPALRRALQNVPSPSPLVVASVNATLGNATVVLEMGIAFPRIIATQMATFFSLTLGGGDPGEVAAVAANISRTLNSTEYAELLVTLATANESAAGVAFPVDLSPTLRTWLNYTVDARTQLTGVGTDLNVPVQTAFNLTTNVTTSLIPTTKLGPVQELFVAGGNASPSPTTINTDGPGTPPVGLAALAVLPLLLLMLWCWWRRSRGGGGDGRGATKPPTIPSTRVAVTPGTPARISPPRLQLSQVAVAIPAPGEPSTGRLSRRPSTVGMRRPSVANLAAVGHAAAGPATTSRSQGPTPRDATGRRSMVVNAALLTDRTSGATPRSDDNARRLSHAASARRLSMAATAPTTNIISTTAMSHVAHGLAFARGAGVQPLRVQPHEYAPSGVAVVGGGGGAGVGVAPSLRRASAAAASPASMRRLSSAPGAAGK